MTIKTILTLIIISVISSSVIKAQSRYGCQNTELSGTYLLLKDSDGTTPRDDATIHLILTGTSAHIHAVMTNVDILSDGEYSACQNHITISFHDFEFAADNQSFEYLDGSLVLPFVVLGGVENGSSYWKKISGNDDSNEQADNNNGSNNNNNNESANNGDDGANNDNSNNDGSDASSDNNESNNNSSNNETTTNNSNEIDNNDIAPELKDYVGDYIGTGWGWEVRFKQTSGDFVSQFTGVDKDALPFEGDKIIMTLLVQHAIKFNININEDGQVTGEGEIIYNLIPNLCGVAVLTEQVNSSINLMGEIAFFFDLGATIGKQSVSSFKSKFLGVQGDLARNMKSAYEIGTPFVMEYAGIVLPDKIKNLNLEAQKSAALCSCAAGISSIEGGTQVGPATLQDLITSVGIDAAKAILLDFGKPGGFMLSIPGLTQIQYYYKGLQNGPETRTFNIMGYLVDGQLYLEMDGNVMGGSQDLTIEYMVNYEKETPSFPTWSPFLQEPARMYPKGGEMTLYEQKTFTKKEKYIDKVTGETKTVDVDYTETIETTEELPFPFATFRESGKQRNGISVWHEYEYNWTVYKK